MTAVLTVLVPAVVGHELAGRLALRLRRELDRGPLQGGRRGRRGRGQLGGRADRGVGAASVLGASSSPAGHDGDPGLRAARRGAGRHAGHHPGLVLAGHSALTEAGFPQVFNPFENESTAEVAKPTGDSVTATATNAAKLSTVKVEGVARHPGPRGQRFRVRRRST